MKAVLYCRVDGPQTSFALDAIKGQQLYLMDYTPLTVCFPNRS